MWHDLVLDGSVFPVRNRPDMGEGRHEIADLLNLTGEQIVDMTIAHELGHAVGYLAAGADVTVVEVFAEASNPAACSLVASGRGSAEPVPASAAASYQTVSGTTWHGMLVAGAAGERAADRWLREQDLWTPTRAFVVELLAKDDRRRMQEDEPRLGFGGVEIDYRRLHDDADAVLDRYWGRLMAVLPVLLAERRIEGAERWARLLGFVTEGF